MNVTRWKGDLVDNVDTRGDWTAGAIPTSLPYATPLSDDGV